METDRKEPEVKDADRDRSPAPDPNKGWTLRGGYPSQNKPPPWKDRLMAIFSGLCFIACVVVGGMVSHDKQVVAFCAVAAVGFLMLTMYFPSKAMDDPDHPDKHYDDEGLGK